MRNQRTMFIACPLGINLHIIGSMRGQSCEVECLESNDTPNRARTYLITSCINVQSNTVGRVCVSV